MIRVRQQGGRAVHRRALALAGTLVIALITWTASGWSQDVEEYARLTTAAQGILDMIETADEDQLTALREAAAAAELAVIDWLDAFFQTEAYAALPPEQQAAAISDRYRWEHNLSVQLIALERCEEATTRIRDLLNRAYSDDELRLVLTEAHERAVLCTAEQQAPPHTRLHIEADPVGAEILVDNGLVGVAPLDVPVSAGEHTVTIRAEGYLAHTQSVTVGDEDLALAPVTLAPNPEAGAAEPVEPPPPGRSKVLEWTLISTGVAAIGTGVALFLVARGRDDTMDNPPEGFFVVDPEGEQSTTDTLDTFAIVAGGVGLAAVITGVVLLAIGGDSPEDGAPTVSVGPLGAEMGLRIGLIF